MRIGFLVFGALLTGIGIVGAFVPLLPTTIFLILAAGCFGKSSPRLERWLVTHPRFGAPLRSWRADGSISVYHKILAVAGIWTSVAVTVWVAKGLSAWWIGVLFAVAAGVSVYLSTRPTRIPSRKCPLRPEPTVKARQAGR